MRRLRWSQVGLPLIAFLSGFSVAGLAANSYMSSPSADSTVIQMPERGDGGRGEIAVAMRTIMERVAAARVPSARLRGGIEITMQSVLWRDGPQRPFLRASSV